MCALISLGGEGESLAVPLKFERLDLPDGHSASESGAEDTRSPDASRPPGVLELREASGVRRVHRRFSLSEGKRVRIVLRLPEIRAAGFTG